MIPVFRPTAGPEEEAAVAEVLRSGWWGLGPKTAEFENRFAESIGAAHCVGTSSASAALLLVLSLLDLGGREVITPALTFVSTNHAILQAGGRPIFADVDPVTHTIAPTEVERLITPRTAAIMAVDYGGHPAELDDLAAIAHHHGAVLVEDAAHSCGATYKDRSVGSVADFTCFSFHAVKNLAMGEGGGITLEDDALADRLRRLRWLGLSRSTWDRTSGDGYSWDYDLAEIGFKAHLSDIAAAIGLVQLGRLTSSNDRRRVIADRYTSAFSSLDWLTPPAELAHVRSAWHLYAVMLEERNRFIEHMAARGIATSVHYKPTHLYAAYADFYRPLPTTESAWRRLVTLPLYPGLTDDEIQQIIDAVKAFEPAA
ncbi:MAG TPA: DegT/DnrJ/EryC1/StrS aminotransferase family protein [Candidatus Limnocylindrales bacterium]